MHETNNIQLIPAEIIPILIIHVPPNPGFKVHQVICLIYVLVHLWLDLLLGWPDVGLVDRA